MDLLAVNFTLESFDWSQIMQAVLLSQYHSSSLTVQAELRNNSLIESYCLCYCQKKSPILLVLQAGRAFNFETFHYIFISFYTLLNKHFSSIINHIQDSIFICKIHLHNFSMIVRTETYFAQFSMYNLYKHSSQLGYKTISRKETFLSFTKASKIFGLNCYEHYKKINLQFFVFTGHFFSL